MTTLATWAIYISQPASTKWSHPSNSKHWSGGMATAGEDSTAGVLAGLGTDLAVLSGDDSASYCVYAGTEHQYQHDEASPGLFVDPAELLLQPVDSAPELVNNFSRFEREGFVGFRDPSTQKTMPRASTLTPHRILHWDRAASVTCPNQGSPSPELVTTY